MIGNFLYTSRNCNFYENLESPIENIEKSLNNETMKALRVVTSILIFYRQLLDSSGFYERDKMFWTYVKDVVVTSACAPPGGGRNPLSARFSRHFGMLTIPEPTDDNLKSIFR